MVKKKLSIPRRSKRIQNLATLKAFQAFLNSVEKQSTLEENNRIRFNPRETVQTTNFQTELEREKSSILSVSVIFISTGFERSDGGELNISS